MTATSTRTALRVIEQFDTVQGEGPMQGRPATFLRLSGCNLSCAWCDTPYSWDWTRYDRAQETTLLDPGQAAADLAHARLIVITGGEPLLQRTGISELLDRLADDVAVQFETNGTRDPGDQLTADPRCHFVVSPKLSNAGDPFDRRIIPGVLHRFGLLAQQGRATLKVVVTTPADVAAARELARQYGFPLGSVWVLPEGVTRDQHLTTLAAVADAAVRHGLNLSTRLHLLAWPAQQRGR